MPRSAAAGRLVLLGGIIGLLGCEAAESEPALPLDPATVPARGWIVWESNREDGRREVYLMSADGSGATRLTSRGGRQPSWSPDGRWIAYSDEQGLIARVMHRDGSGDKPLFSGTPLFWLHDGSGLVCRSGDDYFRVDPDSEASTLLFRKSEFAQLGGHLLLPWPGGGGITHDGRWLVGGSDLYRYGHTGDNGSFKASFAAVALDLQAKDKVFFLGAGCWPVTPPAGDLVYHVCGDCPDHPDLYRLSLADLETRVSYQAEVTHPDADWGHEYNPRVSNDNRWLVYMASTGCHSSEDCDYEIFLHRLGDSPAGRVRLTHDRALDAYPDLFVENEK